MARPCEVFVTQVAQRLLKALDNAAFFIIQNAVRKLRDAPELGKPLAGDLKGLLSWKVSRYRIVYVWLKEKDRVAIIGAGLRREGDRRDVYAMLERLRKSGELSAILRLLG